MVRLLFVIIMTALGTGSAGAQTRVFLTPEKALARTLGADANVRERQVDLTEADAGTLADQVGMPLLETSYTFYEHLEADSVTRRAVIMNVLGQYQPITFIVSMTPVGTVERVEIMVYRESRGSEVRRKAFLEQYVEKSLGDPLRLHSDITNITGATISSRAVTRGVRLALLLNERLGTAAADTRGEDSP